MPATKLKQIRGVWLPDYDDHFQHHLEAGPEFEGHGTYQYAKIQLALSLAPERRGLALDIGAHVGLWSMVLVTHFDRVIAYEPMPVHVNCFKRNIASILHDNVLLHEFALGNEVGRVAIKRGGDNSGNAHVSRDKSFGGVWVKVNRLDDEVYHNPVDLVKIDTEGFETSIILGGEATIRQHKPAIVVEQKPGNAEHYGYGRTEAVEILKSWGAKIKWVKSGDYGLAWD